MQIQWVALASFVAITTFTPGPNNIASMSQSVSHGYRGSLRFLTGITAGFAVVMCLCAAIATLLLKTFPYIEPYLRIAGSLYIVWLAIHTFLSSLKTGSTSVRSLGFIEGFLLQLLNPKVIVYGLTLYSTFLVVVAGQLALIAISATVFASIGFVAVTTWALAGSALSRLLKKSIIRRIVTVAFSLLLLYSAAESSGLIKWLHQ
ncbi:MAG TPA: LysE family transporter [Acidobacteriota bacterium]|nr:LysE family transporter [Acidobacteriota bacterium]